MKYTLVSVIPFRSKWRAEYRRDGMPKCTHAKRIRKALNAACEEEAWEIARALAHDMTVEEESDMATLVTLFLETLGQRDLADSTRDGYRKAAKRALAYFENHKTSCDEFMSGSAEAYVRRREQAGAASNTIHHEISVLRMAMREKGEQRDPFEGVTLPKKNPRSISKEESTKLVALLDSIEGEIGAIAWLAYGCALYTGEIASLCFEDVPIDKDEVHVRGSVGSDGVLRKSLNPRTEALAGNALRRVRSYETERADRAGYLFGKKDAPPSPRVLSGKWQAVASAHGVNATLSDLRIAGRRGGCI